MSLVYRVVFSIAAIVLSGEGPLLADEGFHRNGKRGAEKKKSGDEDDHREVMRRFRHDCRRDDEKGNRGRASDVGKGATEGGTAGAAGAAAAGGAPAGGGNGGYGQTNAYGSASANDSTASAQAREAGTESLHQADLEHQTARTDRTGSSYLSQDFERISGIAGPLLSSPNPSQRTQGEQFLSQKASPPPSNPELYSALDINTNRDVLERGQEIVENLNRAAPEREKSGDQFQDQGEKALAAADKLDGFKNTVDRRSTNFSSLTGANPNLAFAGNSASFSGDSPGLDSRNEASVSLSQKVAPAGDAALTGYDTKNSTFALNHAGNGDERRLASLRDKLRAAIETRNTPTPSPSAAEASDKNAKSAFDSIFDGSEKAPGSSSRVVKSPSELAEGTSAFAMNGSETDREVKMLTSHFGSEELASSEALYGNSDVSIFSRMTKYLVKAQVDKKVAH